VALEAQGWMRAGKFNETNVSLDANRIIRFWQLIDPSRRFTHWFGCCCNGLGSQTTSDAWRCALSESRGVRPDAAAAFARRADRAAAELQCEMHACIAA
jgi:hypothetical protein